MPSQYNPLLLQNIESHIYENKSTKHKQIEEILCFKSTKLGLLNVEVDSW